MANHRTYRTIFDNHGQPTVFDATLKVGDTGKHGGTIIAVGTALDPIGILDEIRRRNSSRGQRRVAAFQKQEVHANG